MLRLLGPLRHDACDNTATAVPATPASALFGRGCVLPADCAVGHKADPRLPRLHRHLVRGARAPVARTLVWGKSASPIQHNAGLCKVKAIANQVGLMPAPLRPAPFAPFSFAQPALCLAPQPSYRNVRFEQCDLIAARFVIRLGGYESRVGLLRFLGERSDFCRHRGMELLVQRIMVELQPRCAGYIITNCFNLILISFSLAWEPAGSRIPGSAGRRIHRLRARSRRRRCQDRCATYRHP